MDIGFCTAKFRLYAGKTNSRIYLLRVANDKAYTKYLPVRGGIHLPAIPFLLNLRLMQLVN